MHTVFTLDEKAPARRPFLPYWRKPLVDFLEDGIWEIRSTLPNTIVRVLFAEVGGEMILLHAFKKKTQKTPPEELKLAIKRKKIYENAQ